MLFHLSNQKYDQHSAGKKLHPTFLWFVSVFACIVYLLLCVWFFDLLVSFSFHLCLSLSLSRASHRLKHFFAQNNISLLIKLANKYPKHSQSLRLHTMRSLLGNSSARFNSIIRLNNLYGQCHLNVHRTTLLQFMIFPHFVPSFLCVDHI